MTRHLGVTLLLLALGLVPSAAAAAPDSTSTIPDTCTYRRCALSVVPVWNGLDVVRGDNEAFVARLGFFRANDISPVFAADSLALSYAQRAVRTRKRAALFTDIGAALLAFAVVGGLADSDHGDAYRALAIGGAISFGIGVPLQFAADGDLSRAVWWYNARLAR